MYGFEDIFGKQAEMVSIEGDLYYGATQKLQVRKFHHKSEPLTEIPRECYWWTTTDRLDEEAKKHGWVMKCPPVKLYGYMYRFIYAHPTGPDDEVAAPGINARYVHADWHERKRKAEAMEQIAAQIEGTKPIDNFAGDWAFLSNFYLCAVTLDGITYDCVEKAYQAAKTNDPQEREQIRMAQTPGQAKRKGKTVTLRTDWEAEKGYVMGRLLRQKFAPGTFLAQRLLATGQAKLIEGNNWHDNYWGVCNCDKCKRQHPNGGQNILGKTLMKIRRELNEQNEA